MGEVPQDNWLSSIDQDTKQNKQSNPEIATDCKSGPNKIGAIAVIWFAWSLEFC